MLYFDAKDEMVSVCLTCPVCNDPVSKYYDNEADRINELKKSGGLEIECEFCKTEYTIRSVPKHKKAEK